MDEHTDAHEPVDTNLGISRRTVLRRGAVVGGSLMWAAPAVQSISRSAFALDPGTPVEPPPPDDCCTADAFGLRVRIPLLGIDQTLGENGCVADPGPLTIGDPLTAAVTVRIVCGEATSPAGGPCTGTASIAELGIVVGDAPLLPPTFSLNATVLGSEATANCDPCAVTGSSTIASLSVNGVNADVNDLLGNCNVDILALLGLSVAGSVAFNRQQCVSDTLTVDALYVNVLDTIEVIAARSMAQADGCACQACT